MSWLLGLILDFWGGLFEVQRRVEDSSVIGKSEFEKEGLGWGWYVAGIALLAGVFWVLRR